MIFIDSFGEQGFRGPAYAFANDPDFAGVSNSVKFWENVIEKFFDKYSGIYGHSVGIIREACERGQIISPSGRIYRYKTYTKRNGDQEWPRAQMLNHIVQGFSADLMILIRRIIYLAWPDTDQALLNNTVHDDVEADVANDIELIYKIGCLSEDAFKQVPSEAKKWFGVDLNVPMEGEVKFGMNLSESQMSKFHRETFKEDYKKRYGQDHSD